jgi:hypothetical protein
VASIPPLLGVGAFARGLFFGETADLTPPQFPDVDFLTTTRRRVDPVQGDWIDPTPRALLGPTSLARPE